MNIDAKIILDTGIKPLIDQFPPVASILEKYQIGCVTCAQGSCRLRDVVEIHNLSPENEAELFRQIAEAVFPGENISIPAVGRTQRSSVKNFSPPIQMLVEEHKLIKRLLTLLPDMLKKISLPEDKNRLSSAAWFIRNFADRRHHAKEEDLLFPEFNPCPEIISVMFADHTTGRNFVKGIFSGLENNSLHEITQNLEGYRNLLSDHIRREDEILYPWIDSTLSTGKTGRLYSQFINAEDSFPDSREKYISIIESLESAYR
ncbi:MAG: hypothetical protein A2096_02960 [Spirochaetes bacterium GWF1_41_5]|nr:MAG: hypothetical protein A2096_02960 [Spirochaetes bacterium GWF1_41_5]HBE03908.1 hypothetical protein [Spirochaetia bacterium]